MKLLDSWLFFLFFHLTSAACEPDNCETKCCNYFGLCAQNSQECSEFYDSECNKSMCQFGCCIDGACGSARECTYITLISNMLLVAMLLAYIGIILLIVLKGCQKRKKIFSVLGNLRYQSKKKKTNVDKQYVETQNSEAEVLVREKERINLDSDIPSLSKRKRD